MPPSLTLSVIRWWSRVKRSNPWNGVAPSPTMRCSSYWKRSLRVTCNWSHQLYLYIYIYVSPSLCHAVRTDLLDPFSPPVSIVHRFREGFQATTCMGTEMLYIGYNWSSYICSSMWSCPREYIACRFVLTSPAVSCMSGSSNFNTFGNGWFVAV